MAWADARRDLKVRTNADTPKDAQTAIGFGAEGIGLTRTEHMFFEENRILKFRKMILSDSVEEREEAPFAGIIALPEGGLHRNIQGYAGETCYNQAS